MRKITEAELKKLVKSSNSYAQILDKIGLRGGGPKQRVKRLIKEYGLDISHFTLRKEYSQEPRSVPKHTRESFIEEVLKVNGKGWVSSKIKTRIIKYGLLEDECAICGLGNVWEGKGLTLHLDHVNGHHKDNRLENLRILCPNCHAQTPTYGRAVKYRKQ